MKKFLIFILLPGFILGGYMLIAALKHNPQGAFWDENGVDYLYSAILFLSWMLVGVIGGAIIYGVVKITSYLLKK